jgi:protein-L-isoaspartate(D-aspartate) O-methyltransferase
MSAHESALDALRGRMVRDQIEARGISDPRVLEAMRTVPRHRFVPRELQHRAYDDAPLAIGAGQTISQPYMVALMTDLLELAPTDSVLEIGTGSGYQAAILGKLARSVVTVERIPELSNHADRLFHEWGLDNIRCVVGDGTLGFRDEAPYDAIIVTAGGPCIPNALEEQLALGGRLVCPVGPREAQQLLKRVRTPQGIHTETSIKCMFVPLIGAEGWQEGT